MWFVSSALPILRTSSPCPRNAEADVRATTCRVGICANQLDSSSVRPSQNDWSDFSAVMSMNGSTTIELAVAPTNLAVEDFFHINAPTRMSAIIIAPPRTNGSRDCLGEGGAAATAGD